MTTHHPYLCLTFNTEGRHSAQHNGHCQEAIKSHNLSSQELCTSANLHTPGVAFSCWLNKLQWDHLTWSKILLVQHFALFSHYGHKMAQITHECGLAVDSPLHVLTPPSLIFPEETDKHERGAKCYWLCWHRKWICYLLWTSLGSKSATVSQPILLNVARWGK